jgi:hypothetical protein
MAAILTPMLLHLILGFGCHGAGNDDSGAVDSGPAPGDAVALGPEILCADPEASFDRFTEEGLSRGLDLDLRTDDTRFRADTGGSQGTLAAEDLDGDGDVDLAFVQWLSPANGEGPILWVHVMENDGTGHFSEVFEEYRNYEQQPGWDINSEILNHALVDLTGDALPDLLLVGTDQLLLLVNSSRPTPAHFGGLSFAIPKTIWQHKEKGTVNLTQTVAVGDVDGDGLLDILVPGNQQGGAANGELPSPVIDRLLRNRGLPVNSSMMEEIATLTPAGDPGYSLAAAMTDRDGDGDLDLLILSELPAGSNAADVPATAFFRNDGLGGDGMPLLTNDAPQLHADLAMAGMGISVHDLNGDGDLDYCLSDIGPARCLISDGQGAYFDSGVAMGLFPDTPAETGNWVTWSLELEDFDADGMLDAAIAAGRLSPEGDTTLMPNAIWQGVASDLTTGGFEDRTAMLGFGDTTDHYGMAATDLDGDGFLDLILAPRDGRPKLWMNRCSDAHWAEIRLEGTGFNRQALGARVEIDAGGRTWTREIHALRSFGQAPPRVHLGLGTIDRIDELRVRWADGSRSVAHDLPTRRTLTLRHPAWTAP